MIAEYSKLASWEGDVECLQVAHNIGHQNKLCTRVSSMLDKTVGKKHLTDGNPETCWTSQQGLPQFIQLVFSEPVLPRRIALTFQGGFVGIQCMIEVAVSSKAPVWTTWTHIHPEDVNRRQVFELPIEGKDIQCMRLAFEKSSDFFGRITIYELSIEGAV